jgi:hypothetical protein
MTCATSLLDCGASIESALERPGLVARLQALGLGRPEIFDGTVLAAGLSIRLAGIAVRHGTETITGSAGSLLDDPFPRAAAELVERLGLLAAIAKGERLIPFYDERRRKLGVLPGSSVFPVSPDETSYRWARSSGVAAGSTWTEAARRARFELIERDRVLRSWFGGGAPGLVFDPGELVPPVLHERYEVRAYSFAEGTSDTSVAAVFAFPRDQRHCRGASLPLVYGFGARDSLPAALGVAASELLQRLGFLFDEALPADPPSPSPTPDFHQEYYLFRGHHEKLRRWLAGGHATSRSLLDVADEAEEPAYVDVSPADGPVVVKALPRGHAPLAFGVGHPCLSRTASLADTVHPIA